MSFSRKFGNQEKENIFNNYNNNYSKENYFNYLEQNYSLFKRESIFEKEIIEKLHQSNQDEQTYKFSKKNKKVKNEKNNNTNINNNNNNFNNKNNIKKEKRFFRLSEMENNNLYLILNVDEDKFDVEIAKKNYKELSKVHHPDKGGEPEMFRKIQKAYKILSNDIYRKLYNNFSNEALPIIDFIMANENFIDFSKLELEEQTNLDSLKVLINYYR
jgi:hypothetical protein